MGLCDGYKGLFSFHTFYYFQMEIHMVWAMNSAFNSSTTQTEQIVIRFSTLFCSTLLGRELVSVYIAEGKIVSQT